MGSAFGDLAFFQHDDFVRVADRREAVGDDQAGAAAPADIFQHLLLGHRVDGAGRFVQDQYGRIPRQGPGHLQSLSLSAAEIYPALRDLGLVAARKPQDVVMDAGVLRRLYDVGFRHGPVEQRDIFPHRAGKLEHVLIHRGDGIHPHGAGNLPALHAVEQHVARPFLVKPRCQLCQRRFSAARRAHDGSPASRLQMQLEMLQERRVERAVAEAHVPHLNPAGQSFSREDILLRLVGIVQVVDRIAAHVVEALHLHFRRADRIA